MAHRGTTAFRAHDGPVKGVDARHGMIASGGADALVRLRDPVGTELGSMKEHRDLINAVRFAPDGRIASGSKDGSVRAWDPASGRVELVGRHDNWVMGVAPAPHVRRVATVSEDATVRIWEPGDGEVARAELPWPANAVDWHPDGSLIAVAGGDRNVYLITADAEQRRVVPGGEQMLWAIRFSPDGRRVAWGGRDRIVRILDLEDGTSEPRAVGRHAQQIWAVTWHPEGDRLVSASADRTARIWSRAGAQLEVVEADEWVRWAGWLDDRLILALEDGSIRLLEDDGTSPAVPTEPTPTLQAPEECEHGELRIAETRRDRCQVCGAAESLRLCMECGHVGCCESQLAHATRHWEETGHPHTTPTSGGRWRWCYECDRYVKRAS